MNVLRRRFSISALGLSLAMALATAGLAHALDLRWRTGLPGDLLTPDQGSAGKEYLSPGWCGGGGGARRGWRRRRGGGGGGWRCRRRAARRW